MTGKSTFHSRERGNLSAPQSGGNLHRKAMRTDSRVRGNGRFSFPAAFCPKLKTMNRVYLESSAIRKIVEVLPLKTGGGADLPIVVAEFALQI